MINNFHFILVQKDEEYSVNSFKVWNFDKVGKYFSRFHICSTLLFAAPLLTCIRFIEVKFKPMYLMNYSVSSIIYFEQFVIAHVIMFMIRYFCYNSYQNAKSITDQNLYLFWSAFVIVMFSNNGQILRWEKH